MARENLAILTGELYENPVIKKEKGKAEFVLRTLRRTGRVDFPIVHIYDENLFDRIESFKKGDFINVSGILTTLDVKKRMICPHCNKEKDTQGSTTVITGIDAVNIGSNFKLDQFKESSNLIILLGTICNESGVEYAVLPGSGIPSSHYQLAINRKYKIDKRKEEDKTADYPWINSFGEQADQDKAHLMYQSQVYIRGGLQTRKIQKPIKCDSCSKDYAADDVVAEVVPYFVEYLDHCKF